MAAGWLGRGLGRAVTRPRSMRWRACRAGRQSVRPAVSGHGHGLAVFEVLRSASSRFARLGWLVRTAGSVLVQAAESRWARDGRAGFGRHGLRQAVACDGPPIRPSPVRRTGLSRCG